MTNNERPWEETRNYLDNRLDGGLAFPWVVYLASLFDRDPGMIGLALLVWGAAVAIWTPWIVLRVRMGRPTGDTARAAAVLGVGLLPWVVAYALLGVATTWTGALIAFPLMYLWGGGAMAVAAFQWPRQMSSGVRAAILVAGGVSYAVVAAGFFLLLTIFGGGEGDAILTPLLVVLGGATALAALAVLASSFRRWTPPRF